jgi:glycosyltransferase involved in cell wall biosynthesis
MARHKAEVVVYVPTASLTLASGMRAAMLRRYAEGAPVILLALQGRRHRGVIRQAARLLALLHQCPDVCVTSSHQTWAQAESLGWPATRILPGVDLAGFTPVTRAQQLERRSVYELPPHAYIVLHAGHLNRQRGVLDLAALPSGVLPVLLASTSTMQDVQLADELRVAGVRVIDRYAPNVAELYQAADAYLFTVPPHPDASSSIDMPLSVLEAMACNLPIIATPFGALPELWPDEEGVYFYTDATGLRNAVQRCRQTPAATRLLVQPYDWTSVAARILETSMGLP